MKKILCLLLSLALTLPICTVASAEDVVEVTVELFQRGSFCGTQTFLSDDEIMPFAASSNTENAYNAILKGLENSAEEIDLADYELTLDELKDVFARVINDNAQLFYVENTYSYGYYNVNLPVILYPNYSEVYNTEACKKNFEDGIKFIISSVIEPNMTDEEKALAVHDYLVQNCDYDMSVYNSTYGMITHSAYAAIVNQCAVCSGYALAYNHILKKLGIEALYCQSESMNHGWSYVKLGGNWYHVDPTWDDPTFSEDGCISGYVQHDYFLLSDVAMEANKHYGWSDIGVSCNSTKYESLYPFSANSVGETSFKYYDGKFYYIEKDGSTNIVSAEIDGSKKTVHQEIVASPVYVTQSFGEHLFIKGWNGPYERYVYDFNMRTKEIKKIDTTTSNSADYKAGMSISGGKLLYYKTYNDEGQTSKSLKSLVGELSLFNPYILKLTDDVSAITPSLAASLGFSVIVSNNSESYMGYTAYAAYYQGGKLLGVVKNTPSNTALTTKEIEFEKRTDFSAADEIKVFIWNNFNFTPYDANISIK